jgi:hypothetical protein
MEDRRVEPTSLSFDPCPEKASRTTVGLGDIRKRPEKGPSLRGFTTLKRLTIRMRCHCSLSGFCRLAKAMWDGMSEVSREEMRKELRISSEAMRLIRGQKCGWGKVT